MKGLPRSGSPMRQRMCRTPSSPATAAIGGGTAVGRGLSDVALSRCDCEATYAERELVDEKSMCRLRPGPEGSVRRSSASSDRCGEEGGEPALPFTP
eukprot:scaffold230928_cov36-Tisochrysis_lutea.AAC.1